MQSVSSASKTNVNQRTLKMHFRISQRIRRASISKPSQLVLYRNVIAVYCERRMEYVNTFCGQAAEFLMLNLAVRILTTGLYRFRYHSLCAM